MSFDNENTLKVWSLKKSFTRSKIVVQIYEKSIDLQNNQNHEIVHKASTKWNEETLHISYINKIFWKCYNILKMFCIGSHFFQQISRNI